MAAVFDNDRQGDFRRFGWGESDEQRMVADVCGKVFGIRSFFAVVDHLCGSGFSCDAVCRASPGTPGGSILGVDHIHHGVRDQLPPGGIGEGHAAELLRRVLDDLTVLLIGAQQARFHADAAGGQRCGCCGELQGRQQQVALADAHDDGFAGVPGLAVGLSLPCFVGKQPGLLSGQVDLLGLAKPELCQEWLQGIDAHAVGQ